MKFAVTLVALTLLAQTSFPAFAQASSTDEIASLPLAQSTSVNVLSGAGAVGSKRIMQLSDAQKEKFYELKNKLLNDVGPKKVALAEQKRLMKDLLTKDTIDRKAILSTQEKINSLKTELANVAIASRLDMQEELTPEQRKAMRYRSLKSGGKHHGRQGKMGGKRHHSRSISEQPAGEEADDEMIATNI
jgi:Spy/CpxP family protein refolding chaperone